MTDYFLDSSALVKRYVQEVGSEWVRSITDPTAGHTTLLAQISLVEVAAAFAARQRAGRGIAAVPRGPVLQRFLQDCEEGFSVLEISRLSIDRAVDLTGRHRLRGYDAVHNWQSLWERMRPWHWKAADRSFW